MIYKNFTQWLFCKDNFIKKKNFFFKKKKHFCCIPDDFKLNKVFLIHCINSVIVLRSIYSFSMFQCVK